MHESSPNHFDRSKPFYPLVVNYVVQLLGFKELALLAVMGPHELDEIVKNIPALGAIPPAKEAEARLVVENIQKIAGPLQLRSECLNDTIDVDVDEIATEVAMNSGYLSAHLMQSAGSLLILAHEISKDCAWHDQGPLWEFLRHCRNAAAHRGTFNCLHGEPRRSASWDPLQITAALQGTPLFKRTNARRFLSPGDPIRLLWDIEQAYPAMTV